MSETKEEILRLEKYLRDTLNAESAPIMGPCLESIRSREADLLKNPLYEAL